MLPSKITPVCCLSMCISLAGCEHFSTNSTRTSQHYNLLHFDRMLTLPPELREISGLAYEPGDCTLYAINDEKGTVHRVSMDDTLVAAIDFMNTGDYEGVALAGDFIYVLESDGDLYEINTDAFMAGDGRAVYNKYPAPWNKAEAEGLCYWPSRHLLLVAFKDLKEKSGDDNQKRIFAFDLASCSFLKDFAMNINVQEIADVLFSTPFEKLSFRLNRYIATEKPYEFFKPSAIAVHPFNEQIYVLNGTHNLMAIFDPDMQLQSVHPLLLPEFRQPEGICFDENGTMYISNEARGGEANILQFGFYE